MPVQSFDIPSEDAMLALGKCWASRLSGGAVVFLGGNLGAGKTTLARGIIRGMGYRGAVISPTYTLVEHYSPAGREVYHFDLYRLEDPAELEMTGLRDLLDGSAILLVEWPQRGAGQLPPPDYRVDIRCPGAAQDARQVRVRAASGREKLPRPC